MYVEVCGVHEEWGCVWKGRVEVGCSSGTGVWEFAEFAGGCG